MAVASLSGLPGETNLAISVIADAGGRPSGPLIETLVTHPPDIGPDTQAHILTYPSSLNPVMAAGGTFWLLAEPTDLNVVNPSDNSTFGWFTGVISGTYVFRDFDFGNVGWRDWQLCLSQNAGIV